VKQFFEGGQTSPRAPVDRPDRQEVRRANDGGYGFPGPEALDAVHLVLEARDRSAVLGQATGARRSELPPELHRPAKERGQAGLGLLVAAWRRSDRRTFLSAIGTKRAKESGGTCRRRHPKLCACQKSVRTTAILGAAIDLGNRKVPTLRVALPGDLGPDVRAGAFILAGASPRSLGRRHPHDDVAIALTRPAQRPELGHDARRNPNEMVAVLRALRPDANGSPGQRRGDRLEGGGRDGDAAPANRGPI
jgi:hypothetical protein